MKVPQIVASLVKGLVDGMVHPKMEIQSLFIPRYVIANLKHVLLRNTKDI